MKTLINKTAIAESRAQEIILRGLSRIPGEKKQVNSAVVQICCPFHEDSNPSCMLNIARTERFPIGYYFCLACGAKGGWNRIAEKLGLEGIKDSDKQQHNTSRHDFQAMKSRMLPNGQQDLSSVFGSLRVKLWLPLTAQDKWRRVTGKTLVKIGAQMAVDYTSGDNLVMLPVQVDGDLVGAIKARAEKAEGVLSYVNSPGQWAKSTGLYPYDHSVELMNALGLATMVLVEGPRDALVMYQNKVPALSMLGVMSWSSQKRDLLLNCGAERILICMDSDKPGVSASNKIYRDLKGRVECEVYPTRDVCKELGLKKLDPAKMKQSLLRSIREEYIK